jgi:hypothetical protein
MGILLVRDLPNLTNGQSTSSLPRHVHTANALKQFNLCNHRSHIFLNFFRLIPNLRLSVTVTITVTVTTTNPNFLPCINFLSISELRSLSRIHGHQTASSNSSLLRTRRQTSKRRYIVISFFSLADREVVLCTFPIRRLKNWKDCGLISGHGPTMFPANRPRRIRTWRYGRHVSQRPLQSAKLKRRRTGSVAPPQLRLCDAWTASTQYISAILRTCSFAVTMCSLHRHAC